MNHSHYAIFFTYKVMSENSGLTHAKDCDACSLWKDVPLYNFWLTWMFIWKCSHRSTCLHTTCHTISYVVLDRHVSTQRVYYETYSCTCSHTKRRVWAHFFLTYEVISMRNFKHITPCLLHNFPPMYLKRKYNHTTFKLTNPSLHATIDIWNRVGVHCLANTTNRETCSL